MPRITQAFTDKSEESEAMQQGIAHGAGGLPALSRIFCKSPIDDLAYGRWNVGRALSEGNRRLFEYGSNGVVNTAVFAQIER